MSLVITVQPAAEPVLKADIKTHLRLDASDTTEDTWIDEAIKLARKTVEARTLRALVNTTFVYKLNRFPGLDFPIELPRAKLQSITSVAYVDELGVSQSFTDFVTDTSSEPGRIYPSYGYEWPSVRDQIDAVTITFLAGYGAAAANVEEWAKVAIKWIVGHWYENREATTDRQLYDVPFGVESLLNLNRWK